ncbi:MAG: helix-turn-helix domain-containing protein [Bacteroidota bacterium]
MATEEQILFSLPLSRMEPILKGWVRDVLTGHRATIIPNEKEEQFLDIKEAAKLLHLAVKSVYALVAKRKIPFMKREQKLYFLKSELSQWIKDGRMKTISEIESDAVHSLASGIHKKNNPTIKSK